MLLKKEVAQTTVVHPEYLQYNFLQVKNIAMVCQPTHSLDFS